MSLPHFRGGAAETKGEYPIPWNWSYYVVGLGLKWTFLLNGKKKQIANFFNGMAADTEHSSSS